MASGGWGGSSSSGGWGGGGGSSYTAPKKKKKAHGVLGGISHLTGNLVGDVADAAAGLPMGLVKLGEGLATHPIRTAKIVGSDFAHAEWQTWSPLLKGDIEGFGHRLMEHPLAPILDVATIATLGAGAAARVGLAEVRAANVMLKSAQTGRTIQTGRLLKNPLIRARQENVDKLLKRLPGDTPVLGEQARYARHAARQIARDRKAVDFAIYGYLKAGKTLEDPKARALAQKHVHEHIHTQLRSTAEEGVIGDSMKGRWTYLTDAPKAIHPGNATWGSERWAKELDRGTLKKRMFTNDVNHALRGPSGQPLRIQRKVLDDYMSEAANSASFVGKAFKTPTRVWRNLVLGTPRYFMNNAVGNSFMFMVNNPSAMHGWYEAVKHIRGLRHADHMVRNTPGVGIKWVDQGFGDVVNVRGSTFAGQVPILGSATSRLGRVQDRYFGFASRWTEEPFRVAMLTKIVRADPEVRSMMKGGATEYDAVMAKIHANPQWRHQVGEHIDNVFGSYQTFNKMERGVRNIIPFYAWDKAITRSTKNTFLDRPGRALMLNYVGQSGVKETKKALGELPQFLHGLVPIGPEHGGRTPVISTAGANPYETFGQLFRAGGSLVGAEGIRPADALGGLLGPYGASAAEAVTGTRMVTGQPTHSSLPRTLAQNFGIDPNRPGLPQLRVLMAAIHDKPGYTVSKRGKRYEKLYDPSLATEWMAAWGIPIKSLSKKEAHHRAQEEGKF